MVYVSLHCNVCLNVYLNFRSGKNSIGGLFSVMPVRVSLFSPGLIALQRTPPFCPRRPVSQYSVHHIIRFFIPYIRRKEQEQSMRKPLCNHDNLYLLWNEFRKCSNVTKISYYECAPSNMIEYFLLNVKHAW